MGAIAGTLPLPGPAWGGGWVALLRLIPLETFIWSFSQNRSRAGVGVTLTQLCLGREWFLEGITPQTEARGLGEPAGLRRAWRGLPSHEGAMSLGQGTRHPWSLGSGRTGWGAEVGPGTCEKDRGLSPLINC